MGIFIIIVGSLMIGAGILFIHEGTWITIARVIVGISFIFTGWTLHNEKESEIEKALRENRELRRELDSRKELLELKKENVTLREELRRTK